jgi:hypothetical protein
MLAIGASFVAFTVIEIVAAVLLLVPSSATNVKLSEPEKFPSGVYVRLELEPVSVPFEGSATTENCSGIAAKNQGAKQSVQALPVAL